MKKLILTGMFTVVFIFSAISQSKYGWREGVVFSGAIQHPLSIKSNTNFGYSLEGFKFSTSFGKASPYQKFGIGISLVDYNYNNGELSSLLPIYLIMIPWIKLKTYGFQPIEYKGTDDLGRTGYYYNPNMKKALVLQ